MERPPSNAGEPRVALRRLRDENLLSLRNAGTSLSKLNVLVGLNASGKSNFAKLLHLLYNVASTGLPKLGVAG